MNESTLDEIRDRVEEVYRRDSRQIFATLVRLVGDFDLAEEAMHEAFAVAVQKWREEGIPDNVKSWLISTGRFKAIDLIRRQAQLRKVQPEVSARLEAVADANILKAEQEISDDRLRLIFTCCHPAIAPNIQVPLTLREVCGLATEEIASAFLVAPATMAQRIVRGKAKIRAAKIPYVIPSVEDLPERLDSVLSVIYLVFNEGYSASAGESLTRVDLSEEAIRLCRLLNRLMPDPEGIGLLGLMLLHESRRKTRLDKDGDLVLLEHQDRSRWNQELIREGNQLVTQSLRSQRFGFYTLQAAISAIHANSRTSEETDWPQIVSLYDLLLQVEPSPIIELNRAVAVAMRDGPEAGLSLIESIFSKGELTDYHLAYSAQGEFLRRLHRTTDARQAFQKAFELAKQEPERRFLKKKLSELPK
ncbi:RNA polymerase sigma factor [Planctomycetales bacterium 10988]|nr:RNA polymerase sigma factor [Planctomycetales bacterium 10988]